MVASLYAQAAAPFTRVAVDWYRLTPMLVLLGAALFLLLGSALTSDRWPCGLHAAVAVTASSAAAVMAVLLWHDVDRHGTRSLVGGALSLDKFSLFLVVVICASAALTALFLDDYLRREQLDAAEVQALVLLAAVGGVVMAMSSDLIVLFLGLETLSIVRTPKWPPQSRMLRQRLG